MRIPFLEYRFNPYKGFLDSRLRKRVKSDRARLPKPVQTGIGRCDAVGRN
jgi:hypothetical protein